MKRCFTFLLGFSITMAFVVSGHAQQINAESNLDIFSAPDMPTPNQYRSANGAPGPAYWQNVANYDIDATLCPDQERITASLTITYTNNSPQALHYLWLQLDQNVFDPNSIAARITKHKERFTGAFAKGGYAIENVRLVRDDETTQVKPFIKNMKMRIPLEQPLAAHGGTIRIKLNYAFIIPEYGADKLGQLELEDGTIFEISQWYPRMFVFDDVHGWNVMPYLGQGEFYLEYGTFDVAITVPRDMIVAATGQLQNPEQVLTEEQQEALEKAWESEKTVTIIGSEEVGDPSSRPDGEGMLTWRFQAENVRDFTWAASKTFIWDAAKINTHDGKPALAQSFYPAASIATGDTVGWERSTQMIQEIIEFYSDWLAPYPYSVATNVAGVIGGMEYPTIVFCSYEARDKGLFGVMSHEFGHQWFAMTVGSDARRYGWMDEGLNTFMNRYMWAEHASGDASNLKLSNFTSNIAEGLVDHVNDLPIMTKTDRVPTSYWGYMGYTKPAQGLLLLREYVLGPKLFDTAFKTYFKRWKFKHPTPADFFRTFENIAGENLEWFWNGWFYTSSKLNPALAQVEINDQENITTIVAEQRGKMIMPLVVSVTFNDGTTQQFTIPEEAFYTSDQYTLVVKGIAQKVVLDPDNMLPDSSDQADVWSVQKGLQPARNTK